MILLAPLAFAARDIDLKAHDMGGTVTGEVSVALIGPGGRAEFVLRDDGAAPDAVAGDHLFTARAEGLELEDGQVEVRAGDKLWQGGFRFDAQSDPLLLIGLEPNGFAAASTHEVVFVPDQPAPERAPQAPAAATPAPKGRTGLPDGMWAGWAVGAAAFVGLGALVWAAARRPVRLPPVSGGTPTTSSKGAWTRGEHRDLFVGPPPPDAPADALRVGEGRWTPEELALAALRAGKPVRVVVTEAWRVEAAGDAYAALARALDGVADLLWAA